MILALIIIGMLELAEGLAIALYPGKVRDVLRFWMELPDRRFRMVAIVALVVGLILIYLALCLRGKVV